MTDLPDEAVEAAAEALGLADGLPSWSRDPNHGMAYRADATAAIQAALPAIEKHLRETVAQEVLAIHRSAPGLMWSGSVCVACSGEDYETSYPCATAALFVGGDHGAD